MVSSFFAYAQLYFDVSLLFSCHVYFCYDKAQASDYRHSFFTTPSNTLLRSTTSESTFLLILALDVSYLMILGFLFALPVLLPGILSWKMVMIFESLPSYQPFNIVITARQPIHPVAFYRLPVI
jgi:hypothetical protein